MKKLLVLSAFLLTFPLLSISQSLIEPGSVWHYRWSHYSGNTGFTRVELVGDTIIQNVQWKVLSRVHHRWTYMSTGLEYTGQETLSDIFLREQGDSLFYMHDNTAFLLFDFSAQKGDSWIVSADSTDCGPNSMIWVDSVGTDSLGDFISIRTTDSSFIGIDSRVYKGIGAALDYIIPNERSGCAGVISHPVYYNLNCFESDSTSGIKLLDEPCEYLLSKLEVNPLTKALKIWPNPANGILHLASNADLKSLELINTTGQSFVLEVSSDQVDISSLPSGTYYFRIPDREDQNFKKLIKID